MGKHAQFVMGPAGSGKSTFCEVIQRHCESVKRTVHVVNLDPAAEQFNYNCSIDIKNLITVPDVMEELEYGPNGGLVYCMEYLVENISWLAEAVNDYGDDYLIFDCPGQIELYSHLPVMKIIINHLHKWGYQVCGVYLIDSLLLSDTTRFVAGALMALSAMIQLELPHVNVISKCDMLQDKSIIDKFLDPDAETVLADLNQNAPSHFRSLNEALSSLLTTYNLVGFCPLDITDEESIEYCLSLIDTSIQYGEDLEPKDPGEDQREQDEENYNPNIDTILEGNENQN